MEQRFISIIFRSSYLLDLGGRYDRVATVMEKSWNFWNFEIFWNFWKSHGISPKTDEGHGKVMEFLNYGKKSWKTVRINGRPLKRSWNFVIRSWKSHGTVMEFCRDNFVATLFYNC